MVVAGMNMTSPSSPPCHSSDSRERSADGAAAPPSRGRAAAALLLAPSNSSGSRRPLASAVQKGERVKAGAAGLGRRIAVQDLSCLVRKMDSACLQRRNTHACAPRAASSTAQRCPPPPHLARPGRGCRSAWTPVRLPARPPSPQVRASRRQRQGQRCARPERLPCRHRAARRGWLLLRRAPAWKAAPAAAGRATMAATAARVQAPWPPWPPLPRRRAGPGGVPDPTSHLAPRHTPGRRAGR